MTIHVVRPNESVDSIATYYGVDPFRLAADNEVPFTGALAVGQTLVIRFPNTVHAVLPGETLSSIASLYDVTVRQLYQNNWELGGEPALEINQNLVISYLEQPIGTASFNGYAYPFIDRTVLNAVTPYLSYLSPFTYGISATGSLILLDDEELLISARQHGALPVLHLSTYTENDRFDSERARLVLGDDAIQNALIEEILSLISQKGFAGVDVDFEFIPAELAQPYVEFLDHLHRVLNPSGYFVWSALAPKTSDNQPGLLYEGHDYSAIASVVDAVLLMTYEWHMLAHTQENMTAS